MTTKVGCDASMKHYPFCIASMISTSRFGLLIIIALSLHGTESIQQNCQRTICSMIENSGVNKISI